ncbi:MAG: CDP-glycerol glycerophosphotransferase family protein [Clostridia bacterium]
MLKKLLILCANFIYCFFKLLPTTKKITMISRQSDKKTIDFELLENKLKEKMPNYKIKILCKKLEGGAKATIINKIKYAFHCLIQMYNISTSQVVILDSYCILISILKHKKNLKVIQMWHSMGTMKKFGYQILDKEEGSSSKMANSMKMHKNYNYVFASGMAYAKQLEEGFNCGMDKIRIYSLPRVDLLTSDTYKKEISKKIYKIYPEIKNKKNIVYCPTFRKNEKNFNENLKKMIEKVDTNKYNLILKLHPLSKVKIDIDKNGIINDKEFSSMDMLFIADYVISDYSCIIYEAAVLNIPLYFFAFDLEEYLQTRGLTLNYKEELPGVISESIEDILNSIENENYDMQKLQDFRKKYIENIENTTEKIVEFILEIIK